MAEHIIEMRPEGANDYGDIVYPVTKANAIIDLDRFGSASGTNAYAVTIGSVPQLYVGLRVTVMFTNANTGASTLNVNGLGAKPIIKANGSGLSSGNIKAGSIQSLVYNGTSFQLVGEGGEYGTALASDVLQGKSIGTEDGLVNGNIPVRTNTDTSGSYPVASFTSYSNGVIHLMPPAGYYNGGTWVKRAEPNFQPNNIRSGVTIGSDIYKLTGTFTSDATIPDSSWLLTGASAYKNGVKINGTMPNRGAVSSTLTTQGGAYTIPAGYHNGAGKVTASFSNLVASNVKSGVNIGGVVGNYLPKIHCSNFASIWVDMSNTKSATRTISIPVNTQYFNVGCFVDDDGRTSQSYSVIESSGGSTDVYYYYRISPKMRVVVYVVITISGTTATLYFDKRLNQFNESYPNTINVEFKYQAIYAI